MNEKRWKCIECQKYFEFAEFFQHLVTVHGYSISQEQKVNP
jgi:hypothetical protein